MDTITHGIAGALLGKAYFAGPMDRQAPGRGPLAAWVTGLAAVFPDSDSFFDYGNPSPVAYLESHRGETHSYLLLPLWALGLAAVTRWLLRRVRPGQPAPSLGLLTGVYAAGIALHIFMDLITSYGTMIWTPLSRARPALDMNFILDFAMTAIVLAPQLAAWAWKAQARRPLVRAGAMWLLLAAAAAGVRLLARAAGVPFSDLAVVLVAVAFAVLLFAPAWRGAAPRIPHATWCRGGVAALAVYLVMCFAAQNAAVARVEQFIRQQGIGAEARAALPMPPALTRWSGLVRTTGGVWQAPFSLLDGAAPEWRFVPDTIRPEHRFVLELPEVRTYLWFARFPVLRTVSEANGAAVELSDMRFSRDGSTPGAFTFRVELDADGRVTKAGWRESD